MYKPPAGELARVLLSFTRLTGFHQTTKACA